MSRFEFRLPDVGEGLVDAEIVAWHVAAGDRVVADQPLVSVETDKAVVEIPAPRSGQVVRCVGEVGASVRVGDVLVELETERQDPGAIVGDLGASREASGAATGPTVSTVPRPGATLRASPAARRRARELGVDIARATPSGPGGVVQTADVDAVAGSGDATVRLKGVRRAMARRMADAGARVVPATVTDVADISAWTAASEPIVRLIRAVVAGCVAVPRLNAAFDDRLLALTPSETVNLGFAMETDDGLFVPVVANAESLSVAELKSEVERLEAAVRARAATPDELRGQTITLSNFGAVAGRHASMVVIPPQVAIVGAGRVFDVPMLDGETVRRGRALPLSVTFDHRAITGVEACRFLDAIVSELRRETAE